MHYPDIPHASTLATVSFALSGKYERARTMSMLPSRASIILPAAMDPYRARVLKLPLSIYSTSTCTCHSRRSFLLQQYQDPFHPVLINLVRHTTSIAASLYYNEAIQINFCLWILQTARIHCGDVAHSLSLRENGGISPRRHTNQIRDFHIEDMIVGMCCAAPERWALIQTLFGFDDCRDTTGNGVQLGLVLNTNDFSRV
ncbi:hypothetical protein C8Q77DRAFT_200300 [Trametes polyzona]|nr:hypothetical protein C8Q77DRAFT_200300 [Trametes polyzona]